MHLDVHEHKKVTGLCYLEANAMGSHVQVSKQYIGFNKSINVICKKICVNLRNECTDSPHTLTLILSIHIVTVVFLGDKIGQKKDLRLDILIRQKDVLRLKTQV